MRMDAHRCYIALLLSLCPFLLSCESSVKKSLRERLSSEYTLEASRAITNDVTVSRYIDAEIRENQFFVSRLEESIQHGFEKQLENFDKHELGFFPSYKYMFNRIFLSEQRNRELWHVKANRYFSNLEIQQEAYEVFLDYNERVKALHFSFLEEDGGTDWVVSRPELRLPEKSIYLDSLSKHSLNNIIIEFGTDVAAWLLVLVVIVFLGLFGIKWTKGYSLVAAVLSIIISVIMSSANDKQMLKSIRNQAVEITTVNYEEILEKLNTNTMLFYEAYR